MKFHLLTLVHGEDSANTGNMLVDSSTLDFPNQHEAHKFALLAAHLGIKNGASKMEISIRRKLSGPEVLNVTREA